ncbi:Uma2 family endonuclease [Thermus sp.]|uniref:Uma2 family endonuclease n=1 Tax=Thermus sp. TaxID=275 RepID=UPI003D1081DC
MPRSAPLRRATFEEFLALEASSPERHELVEGLVFALAGGTDIHNRLVARLLLKLLPKAEEKGCEAFAEGVLLKVGEAAYYPDLFVTCEETLNGAPFKETACLVVEVLSPGTEAIDRGEKLLRYRELPGLQAYALVAQEARRVEIYRRLPDGGWRYEVVEKGQAELPCIGAVLDLEELYRGLPLRKVT